MGWLVGGWVNSMIMSESWRKPWVLEEELWQEYQVRSCNSHQGEGC